MICQGKKKIEQLKLEICLLELNLELWWKLLRPFWCWWARWYCGILLVILKWLATDHQGKPRESKSPQFCQDHEPSFFCYSGWTQLPHCYIPQLKVKGFTGVNSLTFLLDGAAHFFSPGSCLSHFPSLKFQWYCGLLCLWAWEKLFLGEFAYYLL